MKLEIWSNVKSEQTVTLRLIEDEIGGEPVISLVTVDEAGEPRGRGFLLHIDQDGRFVHKSNIDPKLGFDTDAEGQLRIHEL